MRITLLLFATIKDQMGKSRQVIQIPETMQVADLKSHLAKEFPDAGRHFENCLVAINQEFAFDTDLIPPDAEVALFPPVSGGSGFPTVVRVTPNELDLNELINFVTLPSTGAICIFTGVVRAETTRIDPHQTTRLEYEAYQPMAEKKMVQVASEIRQNWPAVEGIVLIQRVGILDPGTPTVTILCSASHRDTGVFEAARYGIDRLKEIVPVWKKEIGPNGEEWVEGEYKPKRGD